ncbi:hypothetical protein D9623_16310 [Azospirillum brasilense]|uniref:Uncharacterized protein n=1 Tax=Azospirillum brasilense TaxID=192 RepID=A0A0P0EG65_AZOBR|nr:MULTISPECIES: hypothetical protein [Azospirillum]ALJ36889.1 hypothetical protein AMK58_15325 [Azospirillum brasilense]MDW7555800.1 hypothetical protein [Azospirillum brasilense]MDW7595877.1 hypothetical protein [Azospirillum brasilense]MDW7630882.1 hypothetical protein [Azospirillum brasilense]MDX5951488.1 hypothetical protein [Azospirillum brasilense]
MLPLLIPVISALAPVLLPEVAKAALGGGETAQKVDEAAVSVVSAVTGVPISTSADAERAVAAVQTDPAKLAELYRQQGDQVVALLRLDNEDRADARAHTVQLAQAGSRISWGAPIVSTIVLVTFGIVLYRVLSQPAGAIDQNATLMLGALTTMASAAVSYWVGSSAGSAAKDKLLRK